MPFRLSLLFAAVTLAATMGLPLAGAGQENCTSSAHLRKCSLECCGRTSCAPSCQSDCVRACIDVCRRPQKQESYLGQLKTMQRRCGYVGGTK